MLPLFLDLDRVLRTHHSLIEAYGGAEGIRDVGLLHSAIAMPQASFGGAFLHKDLFEMAAAYLYHIVQNHPFLDGNKRTAVAAADVHLRLNGLELGGDSAEHHQFIMVSGDVDWRAIDAWLRRNVQNS